MTRLSIAALLLLTLAVTRCSKEKESTFELVKNTSPSFRTMDYLSVANVVRYEGGPHVINLKNKEKHLIVVGCPHSADPNAIEFKLIETYFEQLKPEVIFHEGGKIADTILYKNRDEAIRDKGENGLLKYLADQNHLKLTDGDFTAHDEFLMMLKKYSKEDLFLYYTMERFWIPYRYRFGADEPTEKAYEKFIKSYLLPNGFPLDISQQSLNYFKELYKEKINEDFDINTADFQKFDFLSDAGKFTELGRTSKEVRDSVLLSKIQFALKDSDRVFVTFGGAHVIAIEQAFIDIIQAAN